MCFVFRSVAIATSHILAAQSGYATNALVRYICIKDALVLSGSRRVAVNIHVLVHVSYSQVVSGIAPNSCVIGTVISAMVIVSCSWDLVTMTSKVLFASRLSTSVVSKKVMYRTSCLEKGSQMWFMSQRS
jgi:hypothetical protein